MAAYVLHYVLLLVLLLGLDAVWLGTMVSRLYKPELGPLLMDGFKPLPAGLFYLIYAAGVLALALVPALKSGQWTEALWRGALLGFCAYTTYNLTNYATLRGWSLSVTAADMVWGAVLTGAAATLAFFIGARLSRLFGL
ncbi:MAG: DUF2177 family protein [Alphaproteobacteria bacterium]